MNTPTALDPDKCATQAELAFQMVRKLGRQQIDGALKVGSLMIHAKTQLGHGKFGAVFKRWRDEGMVTFSERSRVRWMLLAKHADAIKSANLANLHEAEQLAKQLEDGLPPENDAVEKATSKQPLDCASALREFESYLLRTLRQLPLDEQREFLLQASAILNQRLEAFEQ